MAYSSRKNKSKHKVGNTSPVSLLESHCEQVERLISQSLFASTKASLTVLEWFHPLKRLSFWSKHVLVHLMDQRKSCWPDRSFLPSQKWLTDQRGLGALLPVVGPGLEVLQGVQRGVVGAQWVRHRWFAEGLLEGGLLQLHDEAIGLLTLRFPLLGGLPPTKKDTLKCMRTRKWFEWL